MESVVQGVRDGCHTGELPMDAQGLYQTVKPLVVLALFASAAVWSVVQAWRSVQRSSGKKQTGTRTPDLEKPTSVAVKASARPPGGT